MQRQCRVVTWKHSNTIQSKTGSTEVESAIPNPIHSGCPCPTTPVRLKLVERIPLPWKRDLRAGELTSTGDRFAKRGGGELPGSVLVSHCGRVREREGAGRGGREVRAKAEAGSGRGEAASQQGCSGHGRGMCLSRF